MSLKRIWTPTNYYSYGGSKRILVIHTMEGFTGPNGAYDCAKYFQGNVGASSQVCIDNNRGTIWEGVTRTNSAWTQCNYNSAAISCEQSGYASWSRDYWLSNRENQLRNIADWLREESGKTGIPLVDISASSAQGSGRGICYHSELGSAGCGHSDPGAGFPLDKVIEWAKGGSEPPPAEEEAPTMVAAAKWHGHTYLAGVAVDGKVKFWISGSWVNCDPGQQGAKQGSAGLAIDDSGSVVVSYVNSSGAACTYDADLNADSLEFRWSSKSNANVFSS